MHAAISLHVMLVNLMGGNMKQAASGMSGVDCATRCFHDSTCSSFFYHQAVRSCKLNSVTYSSVSGSKKLRTHKGALYYEWKHRGCDDTSGWRFLRASELCFQLFQDRVNFASARSKCSQNNGSLLTANRIEIINQSFLLASAFGQRIWLGGHRPDSKWKWVSGEPFSGEDYWQSNSSNTPRRCMTQTVKYPNWIENKCQAQKYYICERPILKDVSYCRF